MAPVGHLSMQRVQRPQVPFPGGSGSRSRSTIRSAIKKYDPISLFIRQEFRPKNPSPACWAAERSSSGTASVKPRALILTPSSSSSSSLSLNSPL